MSPGGQPGAAQKSLPNFYRKELDKRATLGERRPSSVSGASEASGASGRLTWMNLQLDLRWHFGGQRVELRNEHSSG